MAGHLLRCKRCRQPILGDARCCPHCAVDRPARRRKTRNVLLGVLAVATAALGLHHYASADRANGVAHLAAVAASAQKSVQASVTTLLFSPPDEFSIACLQRGGTVVQARNSRGTAVQRCAVKFEDDILE